MRASRKLIAALAIGGLAVLGGHLRAQPEGDQPEGEDVTIPMEKQANLSPAEMKEEAGQLINTMQEMLSRVVELQQVARKQKDVIKLNCVNDKLLQIKQLLNIAEGARTNMVESIAQQDESGRYHHYGQVTISKEKVSTLREEAEACIGEEIIFLGPTEVDVDAPTVPDDPTQDDPFAGGVVIEPPGYASPYL